MQIKKMIISIYNINLIKNVKLLITKHQQIYFKIIKILLIQVGLKDYLDVNKNNIIYLSDMESAALFVFCLSLLSGVTSIAIVTNIDDFFNKDIAIEKTNKLSEIISKDELMKPTEVIKTLNECNDACENVRINLFIFGVLCVADLVFMCWTCIGIENYCWRVRIYKSILNRKYNYDEWLENGNQ